MQRPPTSWYTNFELFVHGSFDRECKSCGLNARDSPEANAIHNSRAQNHQQIQNNQQMRATKTQLGTPINWHFRLLGAHSREHLNEHLIRIIMTAWVFICNEVLFQLYRIRNSTCLARICIKSMPNRQHFDANQDKLCAHSGNNRFHFIHLHLIKM